MIFSGVPLCSTLFETKLFIFFNFFLISVTTLTGENARADAALLSVKVGNADTIGGERFEGVSRPVARTCCTT